MDIGVILNKIRPGSAWSISGTDLKNLNWMDDSPRPTDKEIKDAWKEISVEIKNENMSRLRAKAYREESDPLFFKYQRGEASKEDWLGLIKEIKQRYPYTAFSQQ